MGKRARERDLFVTAQETPKKKELRMHPPNRNIRTSTNALIDIITNPISQVTQIGPVHSFALLASHSPRLVGVTPAPKGLLPLSSQQKSAILSTLA